MSRGVEDLDDSEPAVQLLADERVRAEFTVRLKQFLDTLDLVLPRPEGLLYVKDAKRLSFIYTRARNRYREGMPTLGKSIGPKVRKLIDEHIISLGVDPKILSLDRLPRLAPANAVCEDVGRVSGSVRATALPDRRAAIARSDDRLCPDGMPTAPGRERSPVVHETSR
jgi:hypothetical protein